MAESRNEYLGQSQNEYPNKSRKNALVKIPKGMSEETAAGVADLGKNLKKS